MPAVTRQRVLGVTRAEAGVGLFCTRKKCIETDESPIARLKGEGYGSFVVANNFGNTRRMCSRSS